MADPNNVEALASMFHGLPASSPVQPRHFRLTQEDILQHDLELWRRRAAASNRFSGTIVDMWNSSLDVTNLVPFFLAMLCCFAERCGLAQEFPSAYALTFAPWVCHEDVHAKFNPRKREQEVRARMFSLLIAESNCGKSPFYRQRVDALTVLRGGTTCLLEKLASQFVTPGPGKEKTLFFVQKCTNSDFARRMKAMRGDLAWVSEEEWSALDVPRARGKGKAAPSDCKVQHCYPQNTQNGLFYGPPSINAEQFFVPTTNFTAFHAGQTKVVHDYWGPTRFITIPPHPKSTQGGPAHLYPKPHRAVCLGPHTSAGSRGRSGLAGGEGLGAHWAHVQYLLNTYPSLPLTTHPSLPSHLGAHDKPQWLALSTYPSIKYRVEVSGWGQKSSKPCLQGKCIVFWAKPGFRQRNFTGFAPAGVGGYWGPLIFLLCYYYSVGGPPKIF